MRNIFRKSLGVLAALLAIAGVAYALTNPPTFAPRYFQTQQTHYLRFTVNFNSCALVSNTCSFKVGSVPYNTLILRAAQQIITSFNSGTTDTVALGTASGGAQLVAAQSVHGA